jgi:hypothetical protein
MHPITLNVDSLFLTLSSWMLNELRHIEVMEGLMSAVPIDFIQEVKYIVLQDDEILMSLMSSPNFRAFQSICLPSI